LGREELPCLRAPAGTGVKGMRWVAEVCD
jgi:hypothetical protein